MIVPKFTVKAFGAETISIPVVTVTVEQTLDR
jgi:hypothetical protein